MRHEQEQDLVECRKCEATFNLAAQWYYDNLCPSCKEDEDPRANLVTCTICQLKIEPDEVQYETAVGRGPTERVPVCSDHCARRARTPPWKPH